MNFLLEWGLGFSSEMLGIFACSYKNIDLLSQIAEPPVFRTKLSIFLLIRKKKNHNFLKKGYAAIV